MAQRNIDFGTFPNDPDADAIRTAFDKVQQNFTELFTGMQDQAVLSVNQTPGAGIVAYPTTGNVVISANIACLQVRTSTLSIGRDANGYQSAVITQSAQELWVDLPANIANVTNANFSGTVTSNNFVANLAINSSNTITAIGNITGGNLVTSGALSVTGNANVGNIGAAAGVFTANVTASNVYANSGIVGAGSVLTTTLSSGANTTAGVITGNWTLTAGSRLQATYADLAEYYEADDLYVPGTVVMFGGDKEVTLAEDGTPRVAGVVSTNPAYVMNATCPGLLTAVALQGRVPCKVRGIIKKGDMLISGGNGYARPAQFPSVGTVIGKALQDFNGGEGVVEVAVGRL